MAEQAHQQQNRPQQQPKQGPVDPFADPVAYLKAHNWAPLGNPEWPSCLWVDKSRPMFATYTREPKMAFFLEADPHDPRKGRYVERQVKQRVANAAGHVTEVDVVQTRYTPDQVPVSMQEALLIVMGREHQKAQDARRAKEVA